MSTQPIFQLDEFEDMVGALSIENKTKTSNSITQGWRFGGSVAGNIEIPLSLPYYTILTLLTVHTRPNPSRPVPSSPILSPSVMSRPVPSRPAPPRPVPSRPVPTRPVPSRPVPSCRPPSCPIPPCPVPSPLVPSRPVPSRVVPSRPVFPAPGVLGWFCGFFALTPSHTVGFLLKGGDWLWVGFALVALKLSHPVPSRVVPSRPLPPQATQAVIQTKLNIGSIFKPKCLQGSRLQIHSKTTYM